MPTAQVNDIEINYRLEGDGDETIVLVNGLADDLETWVFQMDDLLAPATECCGSTTAGSGRRARRPVRTPAACSPTTPRALVDELGISGFHLMGTSMGGMIAQEYAINYGSRSADRHALEHVRGAGTVLLADVLDVGATWRR